MSKFKVSVMENPDGTLTRQGIAVVQAYARTWVGKRERDLQAERAYPELTEAFYEVRMDEQYAWGQAGVQAKLVIPAEVP